MVRSTLPRNLIWLMSTLTVLVLLFGYRTSTGASLVAGSSQIAPVSSSSHPTGSAPSARSARSSGGAVTGDVAQTRWGPVQVEITVSGGSITDVSVVKYPTGERQDAEINGYALPILIQETLDAQSASIDMISGATVTSEGYTESLQSALDQAGL